MTRNRRPSTRLAVATAALVTMTALLALASPAPAEEAAPDFTLINQDGQKVTLHQFRGMIVLMNFIYTHCVDICPLATAKLVQVQKDLKARGWFGTRVVFLSMTFDPQRDTPVVLKRYADRFKVDPSGWHFLTGAPPVVDRVVKSYRIQVRPAAKPGLLEHALPTLVIDQRGLVLGHYEPDFNPSNVIRDLTALLGN